MSPMRGGGEGFQLNNLRVSPWEPQQAWLLPGAAPPWVDQTLSWQLWALPQAEGARGSRGYKDHRPYSQLPHNGENKTF